MTTHHRQPDLRNPLVISINELRRQAGARREISYDVPAPEGIGIDMIGVPPSSPIHLELDLQAVTEGVLVSGTATVKLAGECARCLEDVSEELTVDLQELFVYPESEATEEEASRVEADCVDLEPLVRDQVVLELPFTPLCRPDCEGLCVQCGANLNDDPDHEHDDGGDARWAALAALRDGTTTEQDHIDQGE